MIVDDEHGTVLGDGRTMPTPRHDPPSRLADLISSSEPTCCFPGCRIQARRCDLDHRIPYNDPDPDAGGATCSCNLQPLCRGHHRLKTTGLIRVRVISPDEDPTAPPGTLEWTTRTGLTYRRAPSRATSPRAPTHDPQVASAIARARQADRADAEASVGNQPQYQAWYQAWAERDHADATWNRTLAGLHADRADAAAHRAQAQAALDASTSSTSSTSSTRSLTP